jgi:FSR family fosmidomycin resistance protein-like MFS transporter
LNSRKHSYLITFGHVCTDINQGALPALLPFLIATYDLSYAAAATIMLANSVVSAVIQPLFGFLGDKVDRPWFMSLGILLAGAGLALMGLFDSYALILACALLTGTGVALFHPEGGKLANVVAGENKGAGISNFSVGGNLGFGIGPVIATAAVSAWGMIGTLVFLVPALVSSGVLLSQTSAYRRLTHIESRRIQAAPAASRTEDWVGFAKVSVVNCVRAVIGNAMITFIALYFINVLHSSHEFGALMLTVYSLGGAVATFVGGRIADRVGFKRMILLSIGILAPLLLLFVWTSNTILAVVLVVLCSLAHSLGYAPMVALGQAYLPNRVGFASGISLGVVVSMGGIASPGIGFIGDAWGLTVSMGVVCALAFAGLALSLLLYVGRNAHEAIGAPPPSQRSRPLGSLD